MLITNFMDSVILYANINNGEVRTVFAFQRKNRIKIIANSF